MEPQAEKGVEQVQSISIRKEGTGTGSRSECNPLRRKIPVIGAFLMTPSSAQSSRPDRRNKIQKLHFISTKAVWGTEWCGTGDGCLGLGCLSMAS